MEVGVCDIQELPLLAVPPKWRLLLWQRNHGNPVQMGGQRSATLSKLWEEREGNGGREEGGSLEDLLPCNPMLTIYMLTR